MLITLFPNQNQENPVWKQHLEAMSDLKGRHFNVIMAAMAKYLQYLFDLQHNNAITVMQQHIRLTTYDEHNTAISHEREQLRHENTLLHNDIPPHSDQDCTLKVTYLHLSEAEHKWNYACQQLDTTREEVGTHSHVIIHLEHAMEQQDLKLEERAVTIATLEKQL
jgi:cell division protein FtsB